MAQDWVTLTNLFSVTRKLITKVCECLSVTDVRGGGTKCVCGRRREREMSGPKGGTESTMLLDNPTYVSFKNSPITPDY